LPTSKLKFTAFSWGSEALIKQAAAINATAIVRYVFVVCFIGYHTKKKGFTLKNGANYKKSFMPPSFRKKKIKTREGTGASKERKRRVV